MSFTGSMIYFGQPVLRSYCRPVLTSLRRLMLVVVVFAAYFSSTVSVGASVLRLPEFAEPIKNVTLAVGSDVEFSCDVRYLGTYRLAWSWKKEDEQRFLGIGIVKITPNARVQISRIQKSDDVTQFNLYIYNIRKDDEGTYHCSVNSNPMIEQVGTLDVTGESSPNSDNGYGDKEVNGKGLRSSIKTFKTPDNSTFDVEREESLENQEGDYVNSMPILSTHDDNTTSAEAVNGESPHNSTSICIGLNDAWENARGRISNLLSTLMNFTYSYWFS